MSVDAGTLIIRLKAALDQKDKEIRAVQKTVGRILRRSTDEKTKQLCLEANVGCETAWKVGKRGHGWKP